MNIEQKLKEERTNEAMKNSYMGLEGKFSVIVKYLGEPIYRQGGLSLEQSFLDDPYKIEDPDEIPIMEEEQNSYEIGNQFDGLSRGMNMTISVYHHLREITCFYKSQIVYREVSGELEGYAPHSEWEEKIEKLYDIARKIEKKQRPYEKMKKAELNRKNKLEILDYLRSKWGLK